MSIDQMLDDLLIQQARRLGQGLTQKRLEITNPPTMDGDGVRLALLSLYGKFLHGQIDRLFSDRPGCCVFHAEDADQSGSTILSLMVDNRSVAGQSDRLAMSILSVDRQEAPGDMMNIVHGKAKRRVSTVDLPDELFHHSSG